MGEVVGDTLRVNRVWSTQPVALLTPVLTDSATLTGKSYDAAEILELNGSRARVQRNPYSTATSCTIPIDYGTALSTLLPQTFAEDTTAVTSPSALVTLHFTLQADRFTRAALSAGVLSRHHLFLDGQRVNDASSLRLVPGSHDVSLLLAPSVTDTLRLELTGNDLSHLSLTDPVAQRPYNISDGLFGERYDGVGLSPTGRYAVLHYATTLPDGNVQRRTTLTDLTTGRLIYSGESRQFRWMPRRDVAYFTRPSSYGNSLICLDPATMQETVLGYGVPDSRFVMSPDESFLIVMRQEESGGKTGDLKSLYDSDDRIAGWRDRSQLYYFPLSGDGTLQRLTFGRESAHLCDISPDSRRILFSVFRHDATKVPMDRVDLFEYDVKRHTLDTLLLDASWVSEFRYTTDGRALLVTGTGAAFDGIGNETSPGQHPQYYHSTLFRYDLATRTAQHLLPSFAPSVLETFARPADGMVYVLCVDGYDRTLWSVDPTTLRRRRLDLPLSYLTRWSVSSYGTPRLIAQGHGALTARDAYLAELPGSSASRATKGSRSRFTTCDVDYGEIMVRGVKTRLVETAISLDALPIGEVSSAKHLEGVTLPAAGTWSFQARHRNAETENATVHGFYYLPPNLDTTGSYPMIVYYYGGCNPTARTLESAYGLSSLAAMGYVVLVLEPSGAAGFGQEFAARHVNTWGEGSADDIIDGVKQFCEQHPWVDASKIGCMGASYGGFMTQYLQTRTDIFACAVSHAGISNIASYWGGGYWGYSYGEVAEYQSFPWTNPELFTEHSPLFHADRIHTPLLLLHGTADTNVPTTESYQLYNALRILGREVKLVTVAGEDHHVNDFNRRNQWREVIFAWFARHLQGDSSWWDDLGY